MDSTTRDECVGDREGLGDGTGDLEGFATSPSTGLVAPAPRDPLAPFVTDILVTLWLDCPTFVQNGKDAYRFWVNFWRWESFWPTQDGNTLWEMLARGNPIQCVKNVFTKRGGYFIYHNLVKDFNFFLDKVTACGIKVYSPHGQELTNLLQTDNRHPERNNGIGSIHYPTDEEEWWGLCAYMKGEKILEQLRRRSQQCLDHRVGDSGGLTNPLSTDFVVPAPCAPSAPCAPLTPLEPEVKEYRLPLYFDTTPLIPTLLHNNEQITCHVEPCFTDYIQYNHSTNTYTVINPSQTHIQKSNCEFGDIWQEAISHLSVSQGSQLDSTDQDNSIDSLPDSYEDPGISSRANEKQDVGFTEPSVSTEQPVGHTGSLELTQHSVNEQLHTLGHSQEHLLGHRRNCDYDVKALTGSPISYLKPRMYSRSYMSCNVVAHSH